MSVVPLEPAIRLGCFLGALLLIALWEGRAPRRPREVSRAARWPGNLGLVALNTLLTRLAVPVTAIGAAGLAEARGWGVLAAIGTPPWLAVPLAIAVLDLALYLQHVAFHAVPVLWYVHRMHHADPDLDVTTGVRFHPIEVLLSVAWKLAVVAVLGPSALAVLLFEVVLNASSMWSHGNLRLPPLLDHALRWVVVTPDMHRVHHSVVVSERNSNFGFNLSWWDRLGGTYRVQPEAGHEGMVIGVEGWHGSACLRLDRLLLQPFVAPGGDPAARETPRRA
jgi:sterol desaturase/sphingolipid hydroxylase (fatty acid hydroxylase superfamily)